MMPRMPRAIIALAPSGFWAGDKLQLPVRVMVDRAKDNPLGLQLGLSPNEGWRMGVWRYEDT